jgi:endonuclease/exonuclease/phosphatase (EEP) superfamily protein YafD
MTVLPRKKRQSSSVKARKESRGIRRFTRNILLAVNILLVLLLALSYLSVYINPASVAFPALFGLAYPYIAAANLVMIILWILFRRWYWLISALALVAGIGYIHNFIRFTNHGREEHHYLKLMSYNVRLFNFYEAGETNSHGKMLQLLKKEDPGILCLQEYFVKGDPAVGERKLMEGLGGKVYTHFKLIKSGTATRYGIATVSRYPIIHRGDVIHPGSSSLTIYSDIVVDADTFRVYNNHLQSFRLRRMEGNFINEIAGEENGSSIDNISGIYRSLMQGFASRALQVDRVRRHMEKSPYPVIVAGDFNDTPVSYTYHRIRGGLMDAFVEAGYGAGFTYRGKYPPNRIDYVLYSEGIECTDFDIVKVKYSDHYPIIAYFRRAERMEALPGQHSRRKQ